MCTAFVLCSFLQLTTSYMQPIYFSTSLKPSCDTPGFAPLIMARKRSGHCVKKCEDNCLVCKYGSCDNADCLALWTQGVFSMSLHVILGILCTCASLRLSFDSWICTFQGLCLQTSADLHGLFCSLLLLSPSPELCVTISLFFSYFMSSFGGGGRGVDQLLAAVTPFTIGLPLEPSVCECDRVTLLNQAHCCSTSPLFAWQDFPFRYETLLTCFTVLFCVFLHTLPVLLD